MGSGASIETYSDGELLAVATAFYENSPERFNAIVEAARTSKSKSAAPELTSKEAAPAAEQKERAPAVGCTSNSAEIAREITSLREDPPAYAKYLEHHLENRWEDEYTFIGLDGTTRFKSVEGKAAVREAIGELKQTSPMKGMGTDVFLERSSADHATDSNENNLTGHVGSDNSKTEDRISRYCLWKGSCGENIDYGNDDAREIIMHLIIDDAVPDRGHRKNLLSPHFALVGSVLCAHPKYRVCCVMNFALDCIGLGDVVVKDEELHCDSGGDGSVDVSITPEVLKVLRSMPVDEQEMVQQIEAELKDGYALTLRFRPAAHEAEFEFKKGGHTKVRKLSWMTAEA
jgi:uncharacterized protein YkwD